LCKCNFTYSPLHHILNTLYITDETLSNFLPHFDEYVGLPNSARYLHNRVHFIRFFWGWGGGGGGTALLANVAACLVSFFLSLSILEFLSYTDYWLQQWNLNCFVFFR